MCMCVYEMIGEPMMEIHTRFSRVNTLLLLCSDPKNREMVGDGVLFIGFEDGFIEAYNCKTGEQLMSKECHLNAGVRKILTFEQDYYVFSIGNDNSFCSYLVYSQLITMKSVQDLLAGTSDNTKTVHNSSRNTIRINWYRGHPQPIKHLYRNEWCISSDLACVELINGEMYVWCVSTAQLERKFSPSEAKRFSFDRSFALCELRPELPHLTRNEQDIYRLDRFMNHVNCNVLMIDVRSLGEVTLHTSESGGGKQDIANIDKFADLLSLLLDWGINADYESLFLEQFRSLITDIAPCYGFAADFESMTLLFPISSFKGGRWRIQPKVTALYMLAVNTICMWALQCAPPQQMEICSRLVTFYHVVAYLFYLLLKNL